MLTGCLSRAVALETSRGWRIAKEKVSHKIDFVVALAQAALGAVQAQGMSPGIIDYYRERLGLVPSPAVSPGSEPDDGNEFVEAYESAMDQAEEPYCPKCSGIIRRGTPRTSGTDGREYHVGHG